MDRRTLLRGAAAVGVTLGVPAALSGCSTYIRPARRIPGYAIDVAPFPPGLAGLIAARAGEVGITPEPNGGLATPSQRSAAFEGLTVRQAGSFDPVYDRSPRDADLVVVQADASLDPAAKVAVDQGVQVVTYLAPLRHQTAAIALRPGALGGLLAADAAAWAQTRHRADHVGAVFVTGVPPYGSIAWISQHGPPPPGPPPPVVATPDEQAIRATLTRELPGVRVTTVDFLDDPTQALKLDSNLRIILCADDSLALDLAQSTRREVPSARRDGLYVGGIGTPSIGQSGTPSGQGPGVEPWTRELGRDDVLRALATVRLTDLARALVDLPAALMRGEAPYDVALAPVLLTSRSSSLAEYARDSRR